MAIETTAQRIKQATCREYGKGEFSDAFSAVQIVTEDGGSVSLFLPAGAGKSVADAINAAIGKA